MKTTVLRASPSNMASLISMKIRHAKTIIDFDMARCLFREYEAFLNVNLCFQGFEEELSSLPGRYAPPDGALLLAMIDGKAVGCVALRKLGEGICEMKRLYVKPEARGIALGRRLVDEIIATARQNGYALMRLDTLKSLTEAIALYQQLGFHQVEPYYDNPLADALYWELEL